MQASSDCKATAACSITLLQNGLRWRLWPRPWLVHELVVARPQLAPAIQGGGWTPPAGMTVDQVSANIAAGYAMAEITGVRIEQGLFTTVSIPLDRSGVWWFDFAAITN